MNQVRPAAVAGFFYPADAGTLSHDVAAMLADARRAAGMGVVPKAIIVPHAGYVYSGPIAARAYATLHAARVRIRRGVLMGPTHRTPVRGLAVPAATAFASPLGNVAIDRDALARVADLPQVVVSDSVHALEHSLEVHLPFLQSVLGAFTLVPFAVGRASADEVAEVLDRLWGGDDTLIVVSSDLSHYHTSDEARQLDATTTRAILERRSDVSDEQACGASGINGLMQIARHRGLVVELLDQRNSGDTAGDRARVVGYGSYALFEA